MNCLLERGINNMRKDDIKLAYDVGRKIEAIMERNLTSNILVSFATRTALQPWLIMTDFERGRAP